MRACSRSGAAITRAAKAASQCRGPHNLLALDWDRGREQHDTQQAMNRVVASVVEALGYGCGRSEPAALPWSQERDFQHDGCSAPLI